MLTRPGGQVWAVNILKLKDFIDFVRRAEDSVHLTS